MSILLLGQHETVKDIGFPYLKGVDICTPKDDLPSIVSINLMSPGRDNLHT